MLEVNSLTSMLFMVSFLLHIIALSAIYMLFKELQKLKSTTYIEEIDELMTTYLEELREENARLEDRIVKSEQIKAVQKALKNDQKHSEDDNNEKEELENQNVNSSDKQSSVFAEMLSNEEKRHELEQEPFDLQIESGDAIEDSYTASLQSRILLLAEQGFSQNEIAKKLDCGETEVNLVIKMHKRNGKG
ncbi:hypothetical protein QR721_06165 [Aciduricibacillus chroicocephali]|uniref:Uncharacterized protein n=1 Tax=Aciduricibacillus chroicocephali TaxID=3054939 RepID=A0ABY9KZG5_9BACI|nr:hypothetical protein QR721_06165 [Bacillaceae bacterium 44XB]